MILVTGGLGMIGAHTARALVGMHFQGSDEGEHRLIHHAEGFPYRSGMGKGPPESPVAAPPGRDVESGVAAPSPA